MSEINDQFALGKKWFWIGLVMGLNILSGLVFGIALALEKDRRKEGAIIIVFTVLWFIFSGFVLGPWLQETGIIPQYKLLRMN